MLLHARAAINSDGFSRRKAEKIQFTRTEEHLGHLTSHTIDFRCAGSGLPARFAGILSRSSNLPQFIIDTAKTYALGMLKLVSPVHSMNRREFVFLVQLILRDGSIAK